MPYDADWYDRGPPGGSGLSMNDVFGDIDSMYPDGKLPEAPWYEPEGLWRTRRPDEPSAMSLEDLMRESDEYYARYGQSGRAERGMRGSMGGSMREGMGGGMGGNTAGGMRGGYMGGFQGGSPGGQGGDWGGGLGGGLGGDWDVGRPMGGGAPRGGSRGPVSGFEREPRGNDYGGARGGMADQYSGAPPPSFGLPPRSVYTNLGNTYPEFDPFGSTDRAATSNAGPRRSTPLRNSFRNESQHEYIETMVQQGHTEQDALHHWLQTEGVRKGAQGGVPRW